MYSIVSPLLSQKKIHSALIGCNSALNGGNSALIGGNSALIKAYASTNTRNNVLLPAFTCAINS